MKPYSIYCMFVFGFTASANNLGYMWTFSLVVFAGFLGMIGEALEDIRKELRKRPPQPHDTQP